MKEIPCFIENKNKIPKNLIQTYKNNKIHDVIYDNIMQILDNNPDYNYYLITDEIGVELICKYFDKDVLDAFNKLNLGAAKGDFLRYIAMYIYGGVYLDLDSSISVSLTTFINSKTEFIFFLDGDHNLNQWCFMTKPNNPLILKIIQEMVKRINNQETNIFLATGPTLVTDVIYNCITNENVYNTKLNISNDARYNLFMNNSNFMNGSIIYDENNLKPNNKNFHFRMLNYNENMLYDNDNTKYIVTYNEPTPNFYKNV